MNDAALGVKLPLLRVSVIFDPVEAQVGKFVLDRDVRAGLASGRAHESSYSFHAQQPLAILDAGLAAWAMSESSEQDRPVRFDDQRLHPGVGSVAAVRDQFDLGALRVIT